MITLSAEALVTYGCELTGEDERKVLEFMEENKVSVVEAVKSLWKDGLINIYSGNVWDSDCVTQDLSDIEYEI